MKRANEGRRRFLIMGTTGLGSLLVGCSNRSSKTGLMRDVGQNRDPSDTGTRPPQPPIDAGRDSTTKDVSPVDQPDALRPETDECTPTSDDITGPYWREGIPVRSNFDLYNHVGPRLTLTGVIRDEACKGIPSVVIEMWHAQPTQVSVENLSNADTVEYDFTGPALQYYGQFTTGTDGRYTVITKKPGWYLNGPNFRPSHIHARVYVDNVERLTTQLYFKDDPYIDNDRWASAAPKRAVALTQDRNGDLVGHFDFIVT